LIIEPIFHHPNESAIALAFVQKAKRPAGRDIRMPVIKASQPIFQPLFAADGIGDVGNALLIKRKTAALSRAAADMDVRKLRGLFQAPAGW
jgi:hypothetical protein